MRIVVAPDSYKGSVSAVAVAEAFQRGIRQVFPAAEVVMGRLIRLSFMGAASRRDKR